jgi:hypothetical protein
LQRLHFCITYIYANFTLVIHFPYCQLSATALHVCCVGHVCAHTWVLSIMPQHNTCMGSILSW